MAKVARALRPLRRELDSTRTAKPEIRSEFQNYEDRDKYLGELEQYSDLLTTQKSSFEKVRDQSLNQEWPTEADESAAEKQAEEDSKLLAEVDKVLVQVNGSIRRITEKKTSGGTPQVVAATPHPVPLAVTKLPKLTFPTFDGNILNWQNFWDRFKVAVHDNPTLSNVDKMAFLMGQLMGEAATSISALVISDANYPAAVGMLKERFGDTRSIVDSHYTALSEIPRAERQRDLRAVVDKLEQHLNALQALGEDVNHRQFSTMVRSKLPSPTLMQMDKEEKEEGDEWDVDTLRQHLRTHLHIYERSYQKPNPPKEEIAFKPAGANGKRFTNFNRGKMRSASTTSALVSSPLGTGRPHQSKSASGPQSRNAPAKKPCPYCDQNGHYPDQCTVIRTAPARQQKLMEKGLCFNCLGPFHPKPQCPRTTPCFTCKKVRNHHSSLCLLKYPDHSQSTSMMASAGPPTSNGTPQTNQGTTTNIKLNSQPVPMVPTGESQLLASGQVSLLQTATAAFLSPDGRTMVKARGIFDNGSQRSYITTQLAQQLKLPTKSEGKLSVFTFGSSPPTEIDTKVSSATVQLRDGSRFTFSVNVIPTITGNLQMAPIKSVAFTNLLRNLPLADQFPVQPEAITVNFLIGADFMWDFLTGEKIPISNELYLIGSTIGWLLGGRQVQIDSNSSIPATLTMAALYANASTEETIEVAKGKRLKPNPIDLTFMWDLETLGIKDHPKDPGDEEALQNFNQSVIYQDNRYFVSWPWREEEIHLPSNFHLALGRLNSLINKYKSDPDVFNQYQKVIEDQIQKGVIEKVDASMPSVHRLHYIPHHAVINPGRTTKLRIVYDASAKTRVDTNSLNDCLYRGPVILDDIVAIMARFRLNQVAIAADIEKAFLQVGLQNSEKDVTRFLWLADPTLLSTENNIQIYRFTRVPFGITSSPFLLGATIQYHLQKNGSAAALNILRNIYVDNILTGVGTDEEAIKFYMETKRLFHAASMNVREWITNSKEMWKAIPEADRASGKFKVLGIPWDPRADTFSIVTPAPFDFSKPITKRSILQFIASFFDPMGLLSPAIVHGKALLQQLWKDKFDWDTPIPSQYEPTWKKITSDLCSISNFTYPRFIGNGQSYELHAFCDASQLAYGASIYLRIIDGATVHSHLIFAKTRLAPVRETMTIPRLELMAVHMGTKCLHFIAQALPFQLNCQIIWTDSQCVLHWLESDKPLTVFVRNRIRQIKEKEKMIFRHVPTDHNPADMASRGMPARELIQSALWWNGPSFLSQAVEEDWTSPNHTLTPSAETAAASENYQPTVASISHMPNPAQGVGSIIDRKKFSSLTNLLRVTAWCFRVFNQTRPTSSELTAQEIQRAKLTWTRWIQANCFPDVMDAIRNKKQHYLVTELSLWIDDQEVIRCGGRLKNANLPDLSIHPILLPKGDHFTTLVIHHFHCLLYHSGVSHTLAQIRTQFWIPAGRAAVYKVIQSCRRCRRYDGHPYKAPAMPALPQSRVTPSTPFSFTGLDYLGPLYIREGYNPPEVKKVWVCLLTCLASRAIHLEMVDDLSADQFLQCLQRFCARRGIPSIIYSDNAPQFKLVNAAMDKQWRTAIHHQLVNSYMANKGIQWRFIPERAPWMGGFYERLVRSVKQGLRKSLGRLCLTSSQLRTVLTEIEAVINSRPLVYVGADFKSGYSLTPAHLTSANTKMGTPSLPIETPDDPDYVIRLSSKDHLLAMWKRGQAHLDQFWKQWQGDYLLSLRERSQTTSRNPRSHATQPPQVGDIVLIENDGPRGTWQLGQLRELITSSDGSVRSVKADLASGKILRRSVKQIYPLEYAACPNSNPVGPTQKELGQPSTPVPTQRLQRKAAQTAISRIKAMSLDSDSDDNVDMGHPKAGLLSATKTSHPVNATRDRSSAISEVYTIFLLLLLSSFPISSALQPLICQSHEAKVVFDLSPTTHCPPPTPDQPIKEISIGTIHMFKRNIAKYSSTAYRCTKIKTIKSAWTGFAKTGWDHTVMEVELPVNAQECRSMIDTHRCVEGPLLGSSSVAFTDNKADFPYTTGNAWDCCRWYSQEVTNCFLTRGTAYETFGQSMESNLGNTATCEYSQKSCTLPDKAVLIWDTVEEAKCEYVEWKQTTGKFWNGRFLSEDQEIALTWNPDEAQEIDVCDKRKAKMTDQGIPIIYVSRRIKRLAPESAPVNKESRVTEIVAARLQALEERIQEGFTNSLNSDFFRVCQAMQRMQQIDLILAHSEPTLIARHALNESQIMARLNGHLLEVWPCATVESYSVKPMVPPRCSEWIPINFTVQGEPISGFLDPKTNIIFKNSAPAECKLVEELHLLDEAGGFMVYSARGGTIEPFRGSIVHHPLYHENLTTLIEFKEIIHKPLSIYSPGEIRAQTSLNDLFQSMDQTEQILEKLADISDSKPSNPVATNIMENLKRYTPWGLISHLLNQLVQVWIYTCCGYVTISIMWKCIASKIRKRMANSAHKLQADMELLSTPRYHGPVERTVGSTTSL